MSQNLKVSFIKQYILENPSRSFEDVQHFVEEIGGTQKDLELALYIIAEEGDIDLSKPSQTEGTTVQRRVRAQRKFPTHVHIKKKYIATLTILLMLATGVVVVRQQDTPKDMFGKAAEPILSKNSLEKPLEAFSPDPVYANEAPISADRVFSFPSSDITLKYTGQPTKEVVGFFPYWMLSREAEINTQGLTQVNLFGLETDGAGNIIISRGEEPDKGWEMWHDKKLNSFVNRMKRKKVKVLVTIKAFDNDNIKRVTTSDEAQKRFIANAVQLVNAKSLDGINIDFEYVGVAPENTRKGFVRLIANLNEELKRQHPNALLTVDTYVTAGSRNDFFEISLLEEHLDAFIIMGYDIHTPKGAPGPVAPLEGPGGLVGYLQSYLERVSPKKLILAVPYYGYAWPSNGEPGKTLSYAEIAAVSKKIPFTWDSSSQTPFFSYVDPEDNQTYNVQFDNARSLGLKYDYILSKDLAGVGIWALGYDGLNQELQQVLLEKFMQ